MPLQIQYRLVGDVAVVNCNGRIVAGNETQSLQEQLGMAMREAPVVVAHLGEVAFIDSSGLGMLVRLLTSARSRGGDLKLCAVPEMISKTLRMTNLHTVFETYASDADAIASAYQRRQPVPTDTAEHSPTVLCFDESADVLAYVRELLRRAGYNVVTTRMLPDAQVLLKATRPSLIVLGPRVVKVRDKNTQELFGRIAPKVPVFVLSENFSTQDPGEAGMLLLEQVRQMHSGQ
jgi:anti-sigma B factor antagonist